MMRKPIRPICRQLPIADPSTSGRKACSRPAAVVLIGVFLACVVVATPKGRAATVVTGDVTPALPWGVPEVHIGDVARGTLSIDGGDVVHALDAYAGYAASATGDVTVSGAGSQWLMDDSLYVGNRGNGRLRVDSGGYVYDKLDGYLGAEAGSIGEATITGEGSLWTNGNSLYVGHEGQGILNIEAGGLVESENGYVGFLPGSFGQARIIGDDSEWASDGDIAAGLEGAGTLTVLDGARLSSRTGSIGDRPGASGEVRLSGPGTRWDNSFSLNVGFQGSGSLRVESGAQLTSSKGVIGERATSNGVVSIVGDGSTWDNVFDLVVGELGRGALTVADGGRVSTGTLYASSADLDGNGLIVANRGAVLDADLRFETPHSGPAVTSFGDGGVLSVNIDGGSLGAGYKGRGSLVISNGVEAATDQGMLGQHVGSRGSALVSGAGTTWANAYGVAVGVRGSGLMRIDSGAAVSSQDGILGFWETGRGAATISGPGSAWTASLQMVIGLRGNGELRVEAGGQLISDGASIGRYLDATGKVTVTGVDSAWTSRSVSVGSHGRGALRVDAGGQVTCGWGAIARFEDSASSVTVTGAASRWFAQSSIQVGISGQGNLNITHNGLVAVAVGSGFWIDGDADGDSFVNMASGGMLALGGDADGSLAEFLDLITGTDAIRYWKSDVADWGLIADATVGTDYALEYHASGELAGYTVLTVFALGPPGDFNGDVVADGADFLAWQRGDSPAPLSAHDLQEWANSYGSFPSGPIAAATPEPGALCLALVAAAVLALRMPRR